MRRVDVLGMPVDCVTMRGAIDQAAAFLAVTGPHIILAINPEKVVAARNSPALSRCLQNASLVIPDGIGVVIAARLLHGAQLTRVPGAELMPELCRLASETGRSVFLLGGSEDVNRAAAAELRHRFPALIIAGRRNGYFRDAENPMVLDEINQSGAEILFVALGSPRQELWIAQNAARLGPRICQGIGGTLDVLSGRVKRAPAIFRRTHLEWFYRLITNPKRLRRQLALPQFALLVLTAYVARVGKR